MNILDLDLDNVFQECFTTTAGPVTECSCGREHVCIHSNYFDPENEEDAEMIADYVERAKTDKMLVLNYDYDCVGQIEVGSHIFAEGCECEGWKRYMGFILTHRTEIKRFLIQVAEQATIALEHEKTFNVLKDKKNNILDNWNH